MHEGLVGSILVFLLEFLFTDLLIKDVSDVQVLLPITLLLPVILAVWATQSALVA